METPTVNDSPRTNPLEDHAVADPTASPTPAPSPAPSPTPKPGEKKVTDFQAVAFPSAAVVGTGGLFTFSNEGLEGTRYASRYPSVPDDNSGVTLGRGYDMKGKNALQIKTDLMAAGLSEEDAKKFEGAASQKGPDAVAFITSNGLLDFSITPLQQAKSFEDIYAKKRDDTERLCTKDDVQVKYGKCDWNKLHPAIRDILTDMNFRGEYAGEQREIVQALVTSNDLPAFAAVMSDQTKWKNVPQDRFDKRVEYLKKAVANMPPKPVATPKPKP
jgi:hypothetical protein